MITVRTAHVGRAINVYWGSMPLPPGSAPLGVVILEDDGTTGLLLRTAAGRYYQANGGVLRELPQQEVVAALK